MPAIPANGTVNFTNNCFARYNLDNTTSGSTAITWLSGHSDDNWETLNSACVFEPIVATCSASSIEGSIGHTITWEAKDVTGGIGLYYYAWS